MTALLVAAGLILALLAGTVVVTRRSVRWFGPQGRLTAPSCLATLWWVGLTLGEWTGSAAGMAWAGALPLVLLAAGAWRQPRVRWVHPWTWVDLVAWGYFSYALVLTSCCDIECHQAVVGQYLRGNIPPTALNSPTAPLVYHTPYDAVAALLYLSAPLDMELALDVVSAGCLALVMLNLVAISRLLFRSRAAAQVARLFFLVGLGPILVRFFMEEGYISGLHGQTTQTFVDVLTRRPQALSFILFTLALACLLPRYHHRHHAGPHLREGGGPLLLLLPIAYLVPQSSEELNLLLAAVVLPLVVTGKIGWRWVVAAAVLLLLGALRSGVLWGQFGEVTMGSPRLSLEWPPRLPTWRAPDRGVELSSAEALWFALLELGPVFLLTLVVVAWRGTPRERVLALPFCAGLAAALLIRMDGWFKADLDRFLFAGSASVFLLSALWIERLFPVRRGDVATRRRARWFAIVFAVLVVAPPTYYVNRFGLKKAREPYLVQEEQARLRGLLHVVGPRDPVLTELNRTWDLVQAGFVVVAPMTSNGVVQANAELFDAYVAQNEHTAKWLFLKRGDPRVAGKPVHATDGDHVLVARDGPP